MKPTVRTPRNTIIDQKPKCADLAKDDCPREQEADFEVENDEQNGDEIKAHIELHARIVKGVEPALVGRELFRIRLLVGDDEGSNQQRKTDAERDRYED